MSIYRLKSIARRGTMLGATAALLSASVFPAASVFADALNPLTERSLLLSSSAPGWQNTDGSGNSTDTPNSIGENYAPAGSGPNGMRTGETFSFKTSSSASIKAFSLQYCVKAAGLCRAPGNNDNKTNAAAIAAHDNTSDLDIVTDGTTPWSEGSGAGQYEVKVDGAAVSGWTLATDNKEDAGWTSTDPIENVLTGKNNYVTLTNSTGQQINSGHVVEIIFHASETNYITNPGAGAFFVKINTYDSATAGDIVPGGSHNVDGGVTVANVMTDSIHITTKVLETMAFSVGTQNPDTVAAPGNDHGSCDVINQINGNRLQLGNASAENSLETGQAYDQYSYWRLSSNSSGGATVYYSGDTLHNTVGDFIQDMPAEAQSHPGTEQFGLGFVDAHGDALDTTSGATWAANYKKPSSYPFRTVTGQASLSEVDPGDGRDFTALTAQNTSNDYDDATGTITGANGSPGDAKFKFLKSSLTVPEPIAQENQQVISCATAKMRYVANIAADTPAGVYTTKINYLAAPQY